MLIKFLRESVAIITGKQFEEIADLLNNKKHVNEFIIAKKLNMTINQTRNLLYKISNHGLVSSIRKKDKRKGWYTYFWKIEVLKSLEFIRNALVKKIEQIKSQIKSRETKQFYICERCDIEFNEENALLHNFTCNECGGIFSAKDKVEMLRQFKKDLDKSERELKLIDEEIRKEREECEKKRVKVINKQKKEHSKNKKEKRMLKNKLMNKLKNKIQKKLKKKKPKKKAKKKKR